MHPSNTWRQNEIVFDTIALPPDALAKKGGPYRVEIGVYRPDTGTRATVNDQNGKNIGDHVELTIP